MKYKVREFFCVVVDGVEYAAGEIVELTEEAAAAVWHKLESAIDGDQPAPAATEPATEQHD